MKSVNAYIQNNFFNKIYLYTHRLNFAGRDNHVKGTFNNNLMPFLHVLAQKKSFDPRKSLLRNNINFRISMRDQLFFNKIIIFFTLAIKVFYFIIIITYKRLTSKNFLFLSASPRYVKLYLLLLYLHFFNSANLRILYFYTSDYSA